MTSKRDREIVLNTDGGDLRVEWSAAEGMYSVLGTARLPGKVRRKLFGMRKTLREAETLFNESIPFFRAAVSEARVSDNDYFWSGR